MKSIHEKFGAPRQMFTIKPNGIAIGFLQKEKGMKPEKFNLRKPDAFDLCGKKAKYEKAENFEKEAWKLLGEKTNLGTFEIRG